MADKPRLKRLGIDSDADLVRSTWHTEVHVTPKVNLLYTIDCFCKDIVTVL